MLSYDNEVSSQQTEIIMKITKTSNPTLFNSLQEARKNTLMSAIDFANHWSAPINDNDKQTFKASIIRSNQNCNYCVLAMPVSKRFFTEHANLKPFFYTYLQTNEEEINVINEELDKYKAKRDDYSTFLLATLFSVFVAGVAMFIAGCLVYNPALILAGLALELAVCLAIQEENSLLILCVGKEPSPNIIDNDEPTITNIEELFIDSEDKGPSLLY